MLKSYVKQNPLYGGLITALACATCSKSPRVLHHTHWTKSDKVFLAKQIN